MKTKEFRHSKHYGERLKGDEAHLFMEFAVLHCKQHGYFPKNNYQYTGSFEIFGGKYVVYDNRKGLLLTETVENESQIYEWLNKTT